jgi:hypothetical protein
MPDELTPQLTDTPTAFVSTEFAKSRSVVVKKVPTHENKMGRVSQRCGCR